jgi:lysophospholipase L1-like esterase
VRTLKILLLTAIVVHVILLFAGNSSIFSTLLFYVGWFWAASTIINSLGNKRIAEINLLLVATFICLLSGELTIRYAFKRHLTYQESTGQFWNAFSPLKSNRYRGDNPDFLRLWQSPGAHRIKTTDFEYAQHVNSLHLRGPEPNFSDDVFNIIALGDSYTEGFGAPDDSTWIHLLSERLENTREINRKLNYINAGVSGSDVIYMHDMLLYLLKKYDPNLVVMCINSSDFYEYTLRSGKLRYGVMFRLYQISYLFRIIAHDVLNLDHFLRKSETVFKQNQHAAEALMHFIAENYASIISEYDLQMIIFSTPSYHELDTDNQPFISFSPMLAEHDIQFVDLNADFEKHLKRHNLNPIDLYWPADGHFTPQGYGVLADFMYEYIRADIIQY